MCEGYNAAGEDVHPDLEDEFLCEYVDGTMDPVVREVFEEYVRATPDLEEHIECLRHTRLLLCRYGCRCHAPRDLHDRLRREITCDLVKGHVPFHIIVADRLKGVASVSSTMAVLMVIGILAGLTVVDTIDRAPTMVSAAFVTAQDLQSSQRADRIAAIPGTQSVLQAARLSPRGNDGALRHTGRSFVAAGLEKELRRRASSSYVAAFDHPASLYVTRPNGSKP